MERFQPDGKGDKAIGKAMGGWMLKGIKQFAFQNRVRTEFKYQTDADNSEAIQRAMLKVANQMRKAQRNRLYETSSEKEQSGKKPSMTSAGPGRHGTA